MVTTCLPSSSLTLRTTSNSTIPKPSSPLANSTALESATPGVLTSANFGVVEYLILISLDTLLEIQWEWEESDFKRFLGEESRESVFSRHMSQLRQLCQRFGFPPPASHALDAYRRQFLYQCTFTQKRPWKQAKAPTLPLICPRPAAPQEEEVLSPLVFEKSRYMREVEEPWSPANP